SRTRGTQSDDRSPRRQVYLARVAVVGVMLVAFLLSVTVDRSLFRLGVWSFTGFAALFPLPIAALYWKRSTAVGAIACMVTVAVTWSAFLVRAWGQGHAGGPMPIALILLASATALVVGSLVGPPAPAETVRSFFTPTPADSPP
ncbi:MAG: hypothetical protein K8J08_22790, partial [Thermoanaerobaculia bacterium]|nr:hypothetical protein [Thermoanaerobaculia bacterium]